MAITTEQIPVSAAAVPLVAVPPGECELMISIGGTGNTIYLGTSVNVTTANGFPIASGTTIRVPSYLTSSGTSLYAIGSASNIPVGILLSTTK